MSTLKPGDFTGLAQDYSRYRPDYSPSILNALLGLLEKKVCDVDFVDIGAGTGIWTRMVASKGVHSAIAVEPNEDMRSKGMLDNGGLPIDWRFGYAERTGLQDSCCDWITMASSFHWANFEQAVEEFHRMLRYGGRFTALWNPRLVEVNPLLVEIESYLTKLNPDVKRVSSGRSGITETLTARLCESGFFEDVIYMDGRHIVEMTRERYIGAWRSVNDLRVQLGPAKFDEFLGFVQKRIEGLESIEATYLTRAWSARKKD